MTETMKRVRAFEAAALLRIDEKKRPAYHLTGTAGWINDPNGFSVYRGEVHLFFQAYPFENNVGAISWGHAKTRDFVRWERLPAALAPDEEYDRDGCFSGGAVETDDGRHLLLYTGFRKLSEKAGDVLQTQCVAVGDGVDYEKYELNPVLSGKDLPEGGSAADFRDPYIWREDGLFLAAAVNRDSENRAAVLVFRSPDGFSWKYAGTAAVSDLPGGRMWECPIFFTLGGEDALIFSIQGREGDDVPEPEKAFGAVIRLGEFSRDTFRFSTRAEYDLDHGTDFYAPQILTLPDGRCVMTAWMQCWSTAFDGPDGLDFRGQMIFPRELSVKDGVPRQLPVRELEAYRGKLTKIKLSGGAGEDSHEDLRGRCAELDITLKAVEPDGTGKAGAEAAMCGAAAPGKACRFSLFVAEGQGYRTAVTVDMAGGTVAVDLTGSGNPKGMTGRTEFCAEPEGGVLKLKVLLDRFSLELFVNDGEKAASFVLYTPQEADGISFEAEGAVEADIGHFEIVV